MPFRSDESNLQVILNYSFYCAAKVRLFKCDIFNETGDGLKRRYLKEQYPVTAHAPDFDFWTGCREIKRCEESKRTLKNPFASRLTGLNTTLKLLRITDQ